MKQKLKVFVVLLATLLLSCDQKIEPDANLIGKWVWVGSTGGFVGTINTPSSTGQQITIEFTKNRFKKYIDGSLVEDIKYVIKLDNSIYSMENAEIISYGKNQQQSFIVSEQTLILSDECYDCFVHKYTKE